MSWWTELAVFTVRWHAVSQAAETEADVGQRRPEARPRGGPLSERARRGAQEKIVFADEQLVATADTKIATGDVVLTYAASSVVLEVLLHSHQARGRRLTLPPRARPCSRGSL